MLSMEYILQTYLAEMSSLQPRNGMGFAGGYQTWDSVCTIQVRNKGHRGATQHLSQ
jgi:hypothetical protein